MEKKKTGKLSIQENPDTTNLRFKGMIVGERGSGFTEKISDNTKKDIFTLAKKIVELKKLKKKLITPKRKKSGKKPKKGKKKNL